MVSVKGDDKNSGGVFLISHKLDKVFFLTASLSSKRCQPGTLDLASCSSAATTYIPEVISSMRRMGDGCFKSYHGTRVDKRDEVGLNVRRPPNHIPCHRSVNTFKPARLITGN